ncbi:putative guanine deaminase protein [Lasiodiplodia theobromae]|uniref:Guanine deaminase n=2 Tax=Lasiodiplodia theobromae TaxID=45133 RepID=A0A5N5DPW6_9PEZI|nr:Guanine deaminase [Lasiodiplodia theobromae]KAB2579979.1 putative guanine deaminase [Lasiodiplodia theobromae]KAF4544945.1 Guanine deaminase [Lasiodiplodia theobromae]KAF9631596.1 putative guanine deaminase protein [Lasiodiplodia theobromae]
MGELPISAHLLGKTIYLGAFVHCKSLQELDICEKGAIGVDERGKIAFIERGAEDLDLIFKQHHGWTAAKVVRVKDKGFFFPGFIDTHIHAPQYGNAGIVSKSTLLDWLNTYTFPMEASLADLEKARRIYARCVARTLSHGTTTAAYYATIDVAATNLLADICLEKGQRAFIGRVCMDSDLSPKWYRDESSADTIRKSKEVVEYVKRADGGKGIVAPIITPRFAPSCHHSTMCELAEIQKENGILAQTHISENIGEIQLVKDLFPDFKHYADVYDKAGLLNSKMILAHAVHLTEAEKVVIKQRDAKISHCPVSNSALTSGAAPVRDLLDRGITMGLGTDVSGGYSPSILEVVRQTILVSRHRSFEDGEAAKLATEEALYLATRGGAKVVGLEDHVGAFEVGMDWDAQLVSLAAVPADGEKELDTPVDIYGWESWEDRIGKWTYNGDDRNTAAVWVKGRLVHQRKSFEL